MENATLESAREPVLAFLGGMREEEQQASEQQENAYEQLQEALESLNAWSERLEQWQAEVDARDQERDADRRSADQMRVEFEQECDLLRQRVGDLEIALQDRTEELLRAQAANNALAALQSSNVHRPTPAVSEESAEMPPLEFEPPPEGPEVAEAGESVSERFEKLRRLRANS